MYLIHDEGLYQLGLRQWSLDLQDRLIGEQGCAFRHGIDISSEDKITKPGKKAVGEVTKRSEISNLFIGERKVFQIIKHRFKTAGQQKSTTAWQTAHEEAEDRVFGHVFLEVGLQHLKFIEIGKE